MSKITIKVNCVLGADPTASIAVPVKRAIKEATEAVASGQKKMTADSNAEARKRAAEERAIIRETRAELKKSYSDRAKFAAIGAKDEQAAYAAMLAARELGEANALANTRLRIKERIRLERDAAREKTRLDAEARRQSTADRREEASKYKAYVQEMAAHNRTIAERSRAAEALSGERRRFAGRVISNVAGAGRAAFGMASSGVRTAAAGLGMDLDIGAAMHRTAELESQAVALSNQGYMEGAKGAAGVRQDPNAIMREARQVGNMAAYDPNEVISGLGKFVNKTGDLETGRSVMADMAKLSKATNSSLADMLDAAADVNNELGNMSNKGEVIDRVMRGVAAQGKVGAVEIKDLAKQMAKVAAAAGQFSGDRAKNMLTLAAFAQSARATGGAASATQAATAVMSFTGQFSKPARLAGFKSLGIETHTAEGEIRDPKQLLLELFQKTNGDTRKMHGAIMDQQAKRVTNGLAQVYRTAYNETGGSSTQKMQAGTDAYIREMERLEAADLKATEISESFARAMATGESKAQVFNNHMSEAGQTMRDALIGPMEDLAPHLVGMVTTFAAMVSWGAKFFGLTDGRPEVRRAFDSGEAAIKGGAAAVDQMRGDIDYFGVYNSTKIDRKPNVKGVYAPTVYDEHLENSSKVLEAMAAARAAEAEIVKKAEANAPPRFLGPDGKPLERMVIDSRSGKPLSRAQTTQGTWNNAPKLVDGYLNNDDKIKGDEVERQKLALGAIDKQMAEVRTTMDALKNVSNGSSLRVTIVNMDAARQPPGAPSPAKTNEGTTSGDVK